MLMVLQLPISCFQCGCLKGRECPAKVRELRPQFGIFDLQRVLLRPSDSSFEASL